MEGTSEVLVAAANLGQSTSTLASSLTALAAVTPDRLALIDEPPPADAESGSNPGKAETVGAVKPLFAPSAEQLQEEQENVEDVEEDARRDGHGAGRVRSAQAIEIKDRERAEDRQAGHRIDDVRVRNRDEDEDDRKHDQTQQRPSPKELARRLNALLID
jgi:hypothetical protein